MKYLRATLSFPLDVFKYTFFRYLAILVVYIAQGNIPLDNFYLDISIAFVQTRMEEVLDEDMIERNRMMAKLHLMEYDETLKHRVKNDLESEEFPEDFMVDVPDKLPKQSVTRKLSQAEVRLERFKNANARRGNNVTKNPAVAPKKRSDPIFPAKSTCRYVEIKPETESRKFRVVKIIRRWKRNENDVIFLLKW